MFGIISRDKFFVWPMTADQRIGVFSPPRMFRPVGDARHPPLRGKLLYHVDVLEGLHTKLQKEATLGDLSDSPSK